MPRPDDHTTNESVVTAENLPVTSLYGVVAAIVAVGLGAHRADAATAFFNGSVVNQVVSGPCDALPTVGIDGIATDVPDGAPGTGTPRSDCERGRSGRRSWVRSGLCAQRAIPHPADTGEIPVPVTSTIAGSGAP